MSQAGQYLVARDAFAATVFLVRLSEGPARLNPFLLGEIGSVVAGLGSLLGRVHNEQRRTYAVMTSYSS